MGDVVTFKKRRASQRHKGNSLCKSGFHKWGTVQDQRFDVKQGKLVTARRCRRCGLTKTEAL